MYHIDQILIRWRLSLITFAFYLASIGVGHADMFSDCGADIKSCRSDWEYVGPGGPPERCSGGATCVQVCVLLPPDADPNSIEVASYFADQTDSGWERFDGTTAPNQGIGWANWEGAVSIASNGGSLEVCRRAMNWNPDRTRRAGLIVRFDPLYQ